MVYTLMAVSNGVLDCNLTCGTAVKLTLVSPLMDGGVLISLGTLLLLLLFRRTIRERAVMLQASDGLVLVPAIHLLHLGGLFRNRKRATLASAVEPPQSAQAASAVLPPVDLGQIAARKVEAAVGEAGRPAKMLTHRCTAAVRLSNDKLRCEARAEYGNV